MLAVYARSEDLVRIGAYKPGTDADLDRALRSRQALRAYLEQDSAEEVSLALSVAGLTTLSSGL
jgi:flagellum-specific ATP synthase